MSIYLYSSLECAPDYNQYLKTFTYLCILWAVAKKKIRQEVFIMPFKLKMHISKLNNFRDVEHKMLKKSQSILPSDINKSNLLGKVCSLKKFKPKLSNFTHFNKVF